MLGIVIFVGAFSISVLVNIVQYADRVYRLEPRIWELEDRIKRCQQAHKYKHNRVFLPCCWEEMKDEEDVP